MSVFDCRMMLILVLVLHKWSVVLGDRFYSLWFHTHGRAHHDQMAIECFLRGLSANYQDKTFCISGGALLEKGYCIHPSVKIVSLHLAINPLHSSPPSTF